MKQHIEYEQLKDLSSEKKEKIIKLIGFDIKSYYNNGYYPIYQLVGLSKNITICKMIEILSSIDVRHNLTISGSEWNSYNVKLEAMINIPNTDELLMMKEEISSIEVDNDVLCDALWEVVKEIL